MMDSKLSQRIETLLGLKNLEEFLSSISSLLSSYSYRDFAYQSCSVLCSILYKDAYPKFVHHGFMGLIAAIQSRDYIKDDTLKNLPLIQVLRYASLESHSTKVSFQEPLDHLSSFDTQKNLLTQSIQDQDIQKTYSLIISLVNQESERIQLLNYLYNIGSRDLFNLGHKSIYLLKSMELCKKLGWKNCHPILFPAIHYLVLAPSHRVFDKLITEYIDQNKIGHNSLNQKDDLIDQQGVSSLRKAVLIGDNKEILNGIHHLLDEGIGYSSLLDGLQVIAGDIVYRSHPKYWLYALHGFNYVSTIQSFKGTLYNESKPYSLYMTALYLNWMKGKARLTKDQCSLSVDINPVKGNISDLTKAIDESKVELACNLVTYLWEQGDLESLYSGLLIQTAKTDGQIYFAHDLKYCYATIRAVEKGPYENQLKLVLSLVKFLAAGKKSRGLYDLLRK